MTVLPDGRSLAISMSDGIGSWYTKNDRASEDFVTLGGKAYKLDQSELVFDKNDYTKPHQIKSSTKSKLFDTAHCQFDFEPAGSFEEGANLLVLAVRQSGGMGYYKGFCEIEGQSYVVNNAYGMLEHVWSRW
uniref:Uncharacterized protein n=1 Tax=Strombidinopsis acuminata TaxID=141414 RepID=A0A7S3SFH9_9SPIT|mmetsp:Transcript_29671/g.40124  ORF Transcript_29671/g.40124 Transcript_29671/m.40124 type:complete len:132 (+) Transcript_29671:1165-1560(+)